MNVAKILTTLSLSLIFYGCGGGGGSTGVAPSSKGNTHKGVGNKAIPQNIDRLTYSKDGEIAKIKTEAPPRDVESSNEALFVAEGANGVEVIKIGFDDKVSSEVVSKITKDNNGNKIEAKKVTLSEDEKTLLIEKKDGRIIVVDISNISEPKVVGERSKKVTDSSKTSDTNYRYIPMGENGMKIVDLSTNRSNMLTSSNVYDIILIQNDTKALIATGKVGIKLLDLSNPLHPNPTAEYIIKGSEVNGLSIDKKEEILYVATGDKGILVFNLEILLSKLQK
jgi:hypothetical protein